MYTHLRQLETKDLCYPLEDYLISYFGTANDEDLQNMKQDIQRLYDNQVDQANVLNDIISIANVSRGLINENIKKINEIIGTISFLNETIDSLAEKLKPMYITRRFYLLHTETQIHHFRIRTLIRQISKDIDLVKGYLKHSQYREDCPYYH